VTSNATYLGKPAGFAASSLDHVSMYTSDLKSSIEYYRRVFGLQIMRQGETGAQLSVGTGYITLRSGSTPLGVDHFAIGIGGFERESVIRDLHSRGAEATDDPVKGLHVKDPDGFPVQVIANGNGGRA
jgi:catechol 2,3-dioxygenase-like lactoylglutathione lyase family enzyme